MIEKIKKKCKACSNDHLFLINDFGEIPHVNKFYNLENKINEKKYPLRLAVCSNCFLMQLLDEINIEDMFIEYHHMSSASKTNKEYLEDVSNLLYKKYGNKKILEIGSNDLTLINYLLDKKVEAFGVEPAKNLFKPNDRIYNKFLNLENAQEIIQEYGNFDVIFGINVFAHNPNFLELFNACNLILKEDGFLHIEVAYALKTVCEGNYDTIYHEHFCSYTLTSIENVLKIAGFKITDAVELNTQGGSLQVTAIKKNNKSIKPSQNYESIILREQELGLNRLEYYSGIQDKISKKLKKIETILNETNDNLVFIGAPARGVVVLNTIDVNFGSNIKVIDDTHEKLGLCFPGYEFLINNWDDELINNFDTVFILSWNYSDFLINRLKKGGYNGNIIIPFPELTKI